MRTNHARVNGCTKTVTIDETSDASIFSGDTGSEAGMLYKELTEDARKWAISGSNTDPSYPTTLAAIKAGSDLPAGASLYFLSRSDVNSLTAEERVVRNSDGSAGYWWLSDPHEDIDEGAYYVYYCGYIDGYNVDEGNRIGVAPGFRY